MRAVCVRASTSCQRVMASRASSHRAFKKLLLGGYCLGVHNLLLVRKLNPVGLFAFVCVWHCCVRCSHASRMVPLFLGSPLPEQPAGACDLKPGVFGGHAGEASSGLQHPFRNHVINSKLLSLSLSLSRKEKKR